MMSVQVFCVVLCLILLQCSAQGKITYRTDFVMIREQYFSYTFSCASHEIIALSADCKDLVYYDVMKQVEVATLTLDLPGQLLQVTTDGRTVAVAHNSSLSVVQRSEFNPREYSTKTYPTTVVQAASMAIVKDLVCIVPAYEQWTSIQCVNMTNGYRCLSSSTNPVYSGSMAFTNKAKGWIYLVDQGISPQSMKKYELSSNSTNSCINYVHDNPDFGTYGYGKHLWFSYDGTRIFLENGMTLASSNDKYDMRSHGDFNSSYITYRYSYFSQGSRDPNIVAGIRSDQNDRIYFYNWPYLSVADSESIPPQPPDTILHAQEVHICDNINTTFVIVNSTFSDSEMKIEVIHNS